MSKNSPLKQGDMHFDNPIDGVTGKDIETKKERDERYNSSTYTPTVTEVLRTRKGERTLQKPISKSNA